MSSHNNTIEENPNTEEEYLYISPSPSHEHEHEHDIIRDDYQLTNSRDDEIYHSKRKLHLFVTNCNHKKTSITEKTKISWDKSLNSILEFIRINYDERNTIIYTGDDKYGTQFNLFDLAHLFDFKGSFKTIKYPHHDQSNTNNIDITEKNKNIINRLYQLKYQYPDDDVIIFGIIQYHFNDFDVKDLCNRAFDQKIMYFTHTPGYIFTKKDFKKEPTRFNLDGYHLKKKHQNHPHEKGDSYEQERNHHSPPKKPFEPYPHLHYHHPPIISHEQNPLLDRDHARDMKYSQRLYHHSSYHHHQSPEKEYHDDRKRSHHEYQPPIQHHQHHHQISQPTILEPQYTFHPDGRLASMTITTVFN